MELILLLFIFVLAAFLGFELIAKVPSQLHTPLMSGSNAISGITVVGAILAVNISSSVQMTGMPELVAEADVPYEQLAEMDDVNPTIEMVDVAIVIGANDVVNPAATNDKSSPIYGMPIIEAHKAKTGHGGNKLLRDRDPNNFQWSIVRTVSTTMSAHDVIRIENHEKAKHGSQAIGLNEN